MQSNSCCVGLHTGKRLSAREATLESMRCQPARFAVIVDKADFDFGHAEAGEKKPHCGVLLVFGEVPERIAARQSPTADTVHQQIGDATLLYQGDADVGFAHGSSLIDAGHSIDILILENENNAPAGAAVCNTVQLVATMFLRTCLRSYCEGVIRRRAVLGILSYLCTLHGFQLSCAPAATG